MSNLALPSHALPCRTLRCPAQPSRAAPRPENLEIEYLKVFDLETTEADASAIAQSY